ncbi:MAG TPA: TylF/MycF/NovP-related O-methyltransferase [Candidatus Saccharimonadales bacterium]
MHDRFTDHQPKKGDPRRIFRGQPIISDQITREGLAVVCDQLETTLKIQTPGAVVEFGCYAGTTSLFIRRVLDEQGQSNKRSFHVYDSFDGLPEKTVHDNNAAGVDFEAGKLYVSKKEFLNQFHTAHLQPPIIHKGWFDRLSADVVPSPIAFAFLDGDFYGSIISSLRLVWPKMSPGGTILIDDYQRPTLPGVERAIRDFFVQKQIKRLRVQHNIAIIEL